MPFREEDPSLLVGGVVVAQLVVCSCDNQGNHCPLLWEEDVLTWIYKAFLHMPPLLFKKGFIT